MFTKLLLFARRVDLPWSLLLSSLVLLLHVDDWLFWSERHLAGKANIIGETSGDILTNQIHGNSSVPYRKYFV